MFGLYKDPTGEKIFTSDDATHFSTKNCSVNGTMITTNDQQKIEVLIQKIEQMEKENEVCNSY